MMELSQDGRVQVKQKLEEAKPPATTALEKQALAPTSMEIDDGKSVKVTVKETVTITEKFAGRPKTLAAPQDGEKKDLPTVLSVDDDPTNQKVIAKLLRDDYNVISAMSGPECLSIFC